MDKHINPSEMTPQQIAQSNAAQEEFTQLLKSMVRQGWDYRAVLSGAMMATANMVGDILGQDEIPVHFARAAYLTHALSERVDRDD